jgi:omega-6 fatty acid desaturase (delta-12 desaturase)
MRTSKETLLATKPFAHERRWLSWWHLWSTLGVLVALLWIDCTDLWWGYRVPFSLLAGLTMIRVFVLCHDHQHGSFLRGSRIARGVLHVCSLALLNPPSVWKRSHDHHHVNNSKGVGRNVGSFPLMTANDYASASRMERLRYVASRHPLTIVCGYVSIFFLGMCVCPLIANPRRHFDAALSILSHGLLLVWLASCGADKLWLAGILPCCVGSGVGAYLFYAQHNFPGARIRTGRDWNHVAAALEASSFMRMGQAMRWFTGNIGYHHIHHLNAQIPFYRLPEAMESIEELQSPITTSLHPRDMLACLRLKLWNSDIQQFVSWP